MGLKQAIFSIICLIISVASKGEHKVYNLPNGSLLDGVTVEDLLKNSYNIGEWGLGDKINKYKFGGTELYLLQTNQSFQPNAAFVVPAKHIEGFIRNLREIEKYFLESMNPESEKFGESITYSAPYDSGNYEYISIDKKGDSYEYGASMDDIYVDQTWAVMYLRIGKAPKFPYIKDGKQTCFIFNNVEEVSSLINVLEKSTEKNKEGVNPDSFQRIGYYTDKTIIGEDKREVLRYGAGITSKYYINIGNSYIDDIEYTEYLWLKGQYLPSFKKWLNNIFVEYYQASLSKSSDSHIYREFKLPPDLKIGGAITGIFDVEMKTIDGISLNDENTKASLFYSDEDKKYYLSFNFGKYYKSFLSPQQFRNFINALGQ